MNTLKDHQSKKNKCLDTSTFSAELEDLPWQQNNSEEYRQLQAADGAQGECPKALASRRIRPCVPLSLWKSTPMLNSSCDRISQEYQFIPTLETTSQNQENSICYQLDFLARVQATQEVEQDYLTQSQHFGGKDLDVLSKLNLNSVLSNNLKELSNEDFELFLVDSLWQDTLGKLAMSRQQSLGRVIKDSDYLSFPTLTSNENSTSRPAGQTKCEKWFKDKGLIPNGSQLSAQAIASLMNFPTDWFSPLLKDTASHMSPTKLQEELEPDILQDEQLPQPKQRSPSVESSISQKLLGGDENSPLQKDKRSSPSREISIPCLVKQPKQPEVKGVIKQDLGDRFVVEVNDKTISISKLFVYPDFSETVGQLGKSPSKISTPSKNNPRKNRRRKNGQGNGSIYYRTVTKNGKEYQEAYYHYVDNGKKRTKYIPRKLLDRVSEAESRSLPVADILILLGGDKKNPRKSSSICPKGLAARREAVSFRISSIEVEHKINDDCVEQVLETDKKNPRKITPPSKRRKQGYGTGYIECKPIKRSGKEYQQYWYHYEEWRSGDRLSKKSKYIPKRLLARVEKLEAEKAPVREILEVLGMKG